MQTYKPSAHRFKASSNVCVATFLQGRDMNKFTSQMKRFNKIRQATSRKLNAMTQTIRSYHEVGYRCRIETVETFDNLQQLIEAYHDEDAFKVRREAILERMIDSGVLTRIPGLDWRRHLVDCGILNDCDILDSALRLFKNYDETIQLTRMLWPEVPSTSFQKLSNEFMSQEDELVRSDLRRAIEKSPSNIPWRHWLRKSCDQKPTLEENENHDEEEDCSNVANDEDNSENGISESSESDYDEKPAELEADQTVWISPRLKLLPKDAGYTDGECRTFFKSDFIRFLRAYSEMAPELVDQIIPCLKRIDFSVINCFFIGSVPGVHSCDNDEEVYWSHERVGRILEDHACLQNYDVGRCCIVMQSSSIGSVGDDADNNWLTGEFSRALSSVFAAENTNDTIDTIKTPIFLIYPSVRDLSNAISSNNCLCYSSETHAKQQWISNRWRNNAPGGSEIAPHIKCFLRTDPTFTIASWFLLTSGNISQAAWGKLNSRGGLYVTNFEAGVLLLPSFVTGNTAFPLATLNGSIESFNKDVASLIVPFDLPPVRYSRETDEPCFKESTDLNFRQRNRSPCKDKHLASDTSQIKCNGQTIRSYHEVGNRCRIETVETFDNLQQLIEAYHDEDAFKVRRKAILERMIDSGILTRISGLDWQRHLVDCGILNDCEILDSALRLFKNYDETIQLPRMLWPEVPSTSFQKLSIESMRQEDELVRSDLRSAIEKSPSNIPWRHWLRKSCDEKPTFEENENHDEEEDCPNVANDEDNSENGISESSESDDDEKAAELEADQTFFSHQKTRLKKMLPEFLLPTRLPMNVGIGPSLMCQKDIVKAYVAANRMAFFLEGTYLKGKKFDTDLVRLMREPARRNKRKVEHVQAIKDTELFLREYEDQNKQLPKLSPMVMHLFERQIGIVGNAIRVAEKRVEKFLTSDSTTPNEDSLRLDIGKPRLRKSGFITPSDVADIILTPPSAMGSWVLSATKISSAKLENPAFRQQLIDYIKENIKKFPRRLCKCNSSENVRFRVVWGQSEAEMESMLKNWTTSSSTSLLAAIRLSMANKTTKSKIADFKDFISGQQSSSTRIDDESRHIIKVPRKVPPKRLQRLQNLRQFRKYIEVTNDELREPIKSPNYLVQHEKELLGNATGPSISAEIDHSSIVVEDVVTSIAEADNVVMRDLQTPVRLTYADDERLMRFLYKFFSKEEFEDMKSWQQLFQKYGKLGSIEDLLAGRNIDSVFKKIQRIILLPQNILERRGCDADCVREFF
ncbi:unnamed protein product [Ceutorhynchus assimilis]|uniref:Uncharacterized protein n=1 Tax=Ceutorhynchus assimilis TaxID=467358 RepID=A0A9N9QMC9_9CUCU|nr:unnamed protein product [Ceutorhynchus assimilis]